MSITQIKLKVFLFRIQSVVSEKGFDAKENVVKSKSAKERFKGELHRIKWHIGKFMEFGLLAIIVKYGAPIKERNIIVNKCPRRWLYSRISDHCY